MLSSGPLIVERMEVSPLRHQLTLAKRKREEGRYAVDLGARTLNHTHANNNNTITTTDKDIFAQAFSNTLLNNEEVHSSWFTSSTHYSWTRDSVQRESKRHYGVVSLEQQIQAIQQQLLELKRKFASAAEACARIYHSTPSQEFNEARSRCNPFEQLHLDHLFLNRAGIKLANIDALLNFSLIPSEEELTFVDLCGAPGGFSEYILKRCRTSGVACRGWGMSLVGTNEHGYGAPWKLQDILDDSSSVQYNISHGRDGTGDVYHWHNVEFLSSQIKEPVHLVVADGGLDAQRNAECQEQVACKLVVCQASAALLLLQKGGTLVMKMFGFQTITTTTLMEYMLNVFDKMTVLKPISSRPASAERYVIFQGYKGAPLDLDGPKWQSNMLLAQNDNVAVNDNLQHLLNECDQDILELNQKACFQILSYMERKALGNEGGAWGMGEPSPLDMEAYKREWRL